MVVLEEVTVAAPTEYEHPTFSVNIHDSDGDVYENGIFLHYGYTIIKVADTLDGFKAHAEHLASMYAELKGIMGG